MVVIFRHTLRRLRGQIIGWGIGLFLLGLILVPIYASFSEQQEQLEQMLDVFPEEMMAFFGDFASYATPKGFLSFEFFSLMPLILGIFAVLAGSGLLASDEESGILDLVMAHPVSRTGLFVGRLLALTAATVAILAVSWLGLVLPTTWATFEIGWGEMVLPFLSVFAVLMLFGTLALLLSMLVPSRRMAAMISGLALVIGFFVDGLARINEDLKAVARLSPLKYYQGGEAMSGLNGGWFLGLLAFALLFAVLAWWRFLRRDIRVGGEGSWRWPSLSVLLRRGLPSSGQ